MPLIYRAANVIEAQLIVDELKAGGMQAHVTGSYLSGAIGELPPSEVIGVWLAQEQHSSRARDIIDDYEACQQRPAADWTCKQCDEAVGREFGACWSCGTTKPI